MQARSVTLVLFAASLAATLSAAERPLVVDPAQSRVEVAVHATMDSFTGRLNAYEPSITVDDEGAIRGARFAFHFRDLVTGKDGRDKAMHKWQQSDTYPDGLFVLTSLEHAGTSGGTAFGRLTLHGVTREVQFPVSVTRDGRRYGIDGDAVVDTRDFGLPRIRMMGLLKVDPVVHVRFHLQGASEPVVAALPAR